MISYIFTSMLETFPWPCTLVGNPEGGLRYVLAGPIPSPTRFAFFFCSARNPKSVKCNWKHSNELSLHTSCSHCAGQGRVDLLSPIAFACRLPRLLSLRYRTKLKTIYVYSICMCVKNSWGKQVESREKLIKLLSTARKTLEVDKVGSVQIAFDPLR